MHRIGGTPGYLAPEIRNRSDRTPNPNQDVYSVGMIAKEMRLGWRFRRVLSNATQNKPDDRP